MMKPIEKKKTSRVNFNMRDELIERIDEYANSMGITRTGAISILCTTSLDNLKAIEGIGSMMKLINLDKDEKLTL